MKKLKRFIPEIALATALTVIAFASCATLTGCVAPNPNYPAVPGAPAFVPDSASISNTAWQAKQINSATGLFNPYKVPIDLGVDTGAAIALGVSALIAWFRSKKQNASLSKQLAATTTAIESAPTADVLKAQVKTLATVAGVENDLNKRLNP